MIGGLIVTHGRLAIELLNAAEMIVGEIHHITAVSLGWHDDVDMARTMVEKAFERVKTPEGVLITQPLTRQELADLTGTTLYTVSRTLSGWERAGIVEGGRRRVVVRDLTQLARIAQAE